MGRVEVDMSGSKLRFIMGMTKEAWITRKANGNGAPWNKGKKVPQLTGINNSRYSSLVKVCTECNAEFTVRAYRKDIAKYCSQVCAHKARLISTPSYNSIHKWINRQKGSPRNCEHCGRDDLVGRVYDWANISHEYKRELDDWIRLCKQCHRAYDREYQLNCIAVS